MTARAWENLPQKPYGQANLLPLPGELLVSPFYSYTRWLHFYDEHGRKEVIPQKDPEEDFEVNDGMLNLEFGVNSDLALDLTVGITTAATRAFDIRNHAHTDWGLMDTQVGVRYRVVDEHVASSAWMPTLTARIGGIIAGTYQADFPFAPGTGGSGGEVSMFANKELGESGGNVYASAAWRMRNRGVPQKVEARLGTYYDIHWNTGPFRVFTPNVAYKFLNSFGGTDVAGDGADIVYSHRVREISHILESGLGLRDYHGWRWQFYFDWGFLGENTPAVMTYGLYFTAPLGRGGR